MGQLSAFSLCVMRALMSDEVVKGVACDLSAKVFFMSLHTDVVPYGQIIFCNGAYMLPGCV